MDHDVLNEHAADILQALVTGTVQRGGDFTDVMSALEKIVGSALLVCARDGHQLSILRTLVNNVKANITELRKDPHIQEMMKEFAEAAAGKRMQ